VAVTEPSSRLAELVAVIELAERLEKDARGYGEKGTAVNTGWMPFNLFDFAALLFESLTWIPGAGRLLDVGAGPGSKMAVARGFGLDVHGIEIQDKLAAMGRDAGLPVQTADADDWAGYEDFGAVWLNKPMTGEPERRLERRIWDETVPGTVVICANTETRPPENWFIVNDSWDDLRRGSWVKPYPAGDEGGG
jgi:hypothetical protein